MYEPTKVKILFIDECVHIDEEFHFYNEHSFLFTYTQLAFKKIYDKKILENSNFLSFLKEKGVFIDYLIPKKNLKFNSINDYEQKQYIKNLAMRITKYNPLIIITIRKLIKKPVMESIILSGLDIPSFYIPFPTFPNQLKYVVELSNILNKFVVESNEKG